MCRSREDMQPYMLLGLGMPCNSNSIYNFIYTVLL